MIRPYIATTREFLGRDLEGKNAGYTPRSETRTVVLFSEQKKTSTVSESRCHVDPFQRNEMILVAAGRFRFATSVNLQASTRWRPV
jgi:hypothetical protein